MQLNVLSSSQVEQFIESGYTKLEEAFPHKNALAVQDFLWERLAERGVRREDRTTWTEPMVHIQESYTESIFQACETERLYQGIEDLVGHGQYKYDPNQGWGWWPVNFAVGADQPWDVPSRGWHWDGIFHKHFVDSPDQGLLLICIFSEIGLEAGSTLVAEGSHKVVARFLQRHPGGLKVEEAIKQCNRSDSWLSELTGLTTEHNADRRAYFMEQTHRTSDANLRVVETPGAPGDVYLCHPFLYHAASQNHSSMTRFMCNRATPLKERLHLQRNEEESSPIEISVSHAIRYTSA